MLSGEETGKTIPSPILQGYTEDLICDIPARITLAAMGMAFLCGTLLGILTGEWHGTSRRTMGILFTGLFILLFSVFITGGADFLSRFIFKSLS